MDQKQLKTAALTTVKKHYLLLLCICLTAVMFNAQFGSLPSTVKNYYFDAAQGMQKSVLAILLQMLNGTPIGHLLLKSYIDGVQAGAAFRANIALGLLSTLVFAVQVLLFILLAQVIRIILCRIFLEARTYDKVPLQHTLYIARVKKWMHVAIALFEYLAYLFLWNLTIVGGCIKYYSYFCTPFILAENPSLSSQQAITLSRKMMDGHKKEAFLLDLSMIGWYLLSFVTLGIAGIFFTNAYTTAVHSEYYVRIRALAKEKEMENSDLLNDVYLYEKADSALLATTYKSTRMDEMYIADTEVPLKGLQKFFAENLSLWVGSYKQRKVYQGVVNLKAQLEKDKAALAGEQYPSRLSPLYTRETIHYDGNLTVRRAYSFTSLVWIFFLGSFLAWLMQGGLMSNNTTGTMIKFGVLSGPWMPMYGAIGILSLLFFTKCRKNPVLTFLLTACTAGVIQASTGSFLQRTYNMRWWDFSNYYLNVQGLTCLQAMVTIALVCMMFFYIFAPYIDQWLSHRNPKVALILALVLVVIFILDVVHGAGSPNAASAISAAVRFIPLL